MITTVVYLGGQKQKDIVVQIVSQVAEHVYQIQLPLPFALRIVNCYAFKEANSWTIIDTGLNYLPGQEAWQRAFAELGITPAAIQRILLTHAHPDHYGMSGWLAAQSDAPIFISPIEKAFAEAVWLGGEYDAAPFADYFVRYGLPRAQAAQVLDDMAKLRAMTAPHGELNILEPDSQITIGTRRFQALMTPGHSEGHLVFFCPDDGMLLCGDAVLRKITPNVGLWPRNTAHPLASFLHTLDALHNLEVALALPGHGPLITDFRTRIAELRQHHSERLQLIAQTAGTGATVYAICSSVFPMALQSSHDLRFAMAETLAHLEHLVTLGQLERFDREEIIYRVV
jgi:glyoxylase-like metal-dependent hydrolase (beta-lactamase superfamily II)